ncbi:hypothetical protein POV86_09715, partial [Enterobacter roggenkampii]|uniref:hypothetical protein n=1 Tax=Enterobacter roggenkampii TaxID=1812935 RepID=UPI002FF57170
SLKTSIKTITNLSDTNCLEIQGASLQNIKKQNRPAGFSFYHPLIKGDPVYVVQTCVTSVKREVKRARLKFPGELQ